MIKDRILRCDLCACAGPKAPTPAAVYELARLKGWARGHYRRRGKVLHQHADLCPRCAALEAIRAEAVAAQG